MAANSGSPADDNLTQAESALRQKKYREAITWATKAIDQSPSNPTAYVIRAHANKALGQANEAIVDLTKAIELKPDASAYHWLRGAWYSEIDEHAKAIADIRSALQLNPQIPGAYRQLGREQFKRAEIAASIADFDRFVELEPNHEMIYGNEACRYYAGQFGLAIRSFEDYHKFGSTDIENGLWRMISQVEVDGLPKAQKDLLEYKNKTRPPFPALYELYSGSATKGDTGTRNRWGRR